MDHFEIEKITSFELIKKTCWIRLYWSSEIYSYGNILREYANFPKFLPLAIKSDHSGPDFNILYTDDELSNETEFYLGHNHKKNIEHNFKLKTKRFKTIISPFVFYRRKNNHIYNPKNIGTIAFPVHSDLNVNRVDYFEDYFLDLKRLDKKFHPITVCFHQHDILNGNYKRFYNQGFEIVTVGNTHDERFAERFYKLIDNFKYITSNAPSTITFLAIEMKVPFFIYGNSNILPPLIADNQVILSSLYYELFELLKLEDNKINILPNEIVLEIESMLGVNNSISSKELKRILYLSLIYWIIKGKFIYWIIKRLFSYINIKIKF